MGREKSAYRNCVGWRSLYIHRDLCIHEGVVCIKKFVEEG